MNCITVGTTAKYTVQSGDVGYRFKLSISVKNGLGTTIVLSTLSAAVGGGDPASPPPPPPPPPSPPPPPPPPPLSIQTSTFTGTLNKNTSSLSFPISIGAAQANASLTFSKSATMTVKLLNTTGAVVGQVSGGTSPLTLTVPVLVAGSYRCVVSGAGYKGSVSFTLTVTAAAP